MIKILYRYDAELFFVIKAIAERSESSLHETEPKTMLIFKRKNAIRLSNNDSSLRLFIDKNMKDLKHRENIEDE